jgi:hypothetical protein
MPIVIAMCAGVMSAVAVRVVTVLFHEEFSARSQFAMPPLIEGTSALS